MLKYVIPIAGFLLVQLLVGVADGQSTESAAQWTLVRLDPDDKWSHSSCLGDAEFLSFIGTFPSLAQTWT